MDELLTNATRFYIDGAWVAPLSDNRIPVVNPATEEPITDVALGSEPDAELAVQAARRAFDSWSRTTPHERLDVLRAVLAVYQRRAEELASVVSAELGAPISLARALHVPAGLGHLATYSEILAGYRFTEQRGSTTVIREPAGVCGLITPWNWPLNQIACKVAPALAAGCTVVLKPSEVAPLNAVLFAEILDEAGVPAGVFNLVNGLGQSVGRVLTTHPEVDMVSFTGSTRAGIEVSKAAADTVKKVSLELGGKSANIVLPDADLPEAAAGAISACYLNSGQTCNAATRLLVHVDQHDEIVDLLRAQVANVVTGDPLDEGTVLGPLISRPQYDHVQELIRSGIDEGANLAAGGPGLPDGLDRGYYVRPTVFSGVTSGMRIAQEEIFGPVLSVLTYTDEEDAIAIANDSEYGLSGAVQSADPDSAYRVASRIRTGTVHLNGATSDLSAPFGGYRKSGNGREWGVLGLEEFTEVKAVLGATPG